MKCSNHDLIKVHGTEFFKKKKQEKLVVVKFEKLIGENLLLNFNLT
jgi:hypothetical protein